MQKTSKANLSIAILCSLLISLPLVGMIFPSIDVTPRMIENRQLAEAPTLNWASLTSFPKQFDNYFNDHFGFRDFLIRQNIKFKDNILNIETDEGIEVLRGKDGWLFFTGNSMMDAYRGFKPLTLEQLELWRNTLERKRAFLKSQGIEYLFVIAPNKSSIYSEYLPAWAKNTSKETPLDQLVAYLKENSETEILDLRAVIMKEKNHSSLLYYPTDTHWNQLGAFVAYGEIMRNIGPLLHKTAALSPDNIKIEYREKKGGDLATMLGTQEEIIEKKPILTPLISHAKKTYSTDGPPNEVLMESQVVGLPRAIMFRDSFADALVPYLSEDFSYIRYILENWTDETPIDKLLNESKPDIVIEEQVERSIR